MDVTSLLSLNTTKLMMKHTAKHISIVLRRPIAFTIQPEKKLPTMPLPARTIIVKPRCCSTFVDFEMLCTHVGAHEKIAHKPISIAPKITEPVTKFFLMFGAKSLSLVFSFCVDESLLA